MCEKIYELKSIFSLWRERERERERERDGERERERAGRLGRSNKINLKPKSIATFYLKHINL